MARNVARTNNPAKAERRVPGDDPGVARVRNEPVDQREGFKVSAASIGGILVGAAVGGALGLIAAAFPVVNWWMGLMIGVICGSIAAAMIAARLELGTLQDESLPPVVKHTGESGARRRERRLR